METYQDIKAEVINDTHIYGYNCLYDGEESCKHALCFNTNIMKRMKICISRTKNHNQAHDMLLLYEEDMKTLE